MNTLPASTTATSRCLVVGDVMLDRYISGEATRISPEAPVPVVAVRQTFSRLGGAGNVAGNVCSLGGRSELLGIVGKDQAGSEVNSLVAEFGIGGRGLYSSCSWPTTVKTRVLAQSQQVVRFDFEGDKNAIERSVFDSLSERFCELVGEVQFIILSDYGKGLCSDALCRRVITEAAAVGAKVLVDPKGRSYEKYRNAYVITPNRQELSLLCGRELPDLSSQVGAASWLRETFEISCVVLTLGEQGMVVVDGKDSITYIPAIAKKVFDVTGAGDTVVAALAVALGEGASMEDAARFANAAASVKVGNVGTFCVSLEEARAALRGYASGVRRRIYDDNALVSLVQSARDAGKRIGFTNGCFDLFHVGHVGLLQAASQTCDVLIVAVNSDSSVRRLKGPPRPFVPIGDRMSVVAAIEGVGAVCSFEEDDPSRLIELLKPDVLIKGGDYSPANIVGAAAVESRGGQVVIIPLVPDTSTTRLASKVIDLAVSKSV